MALILNDRVHETTTSSGVGVLQLSGPILGAQSFASGIGNNQTYYAIISPLGPWETGVGTNAAGVFTRNQIYANSLGQTSAIVFGTEVKDVICTLPGSIAEGLIAATSGIAGGAATWPSGNVTAPGWPNTTNVGDGLYEIAAGTVGIATGGHDNLRLINTSAAVNYVTITNAVSGTTGPTISVAGSDGNANLRLATKGSGNVFMVSGTITNLAAPSSSSDAATKGYVDNAIAGLDYKQAVNEATAAALPTNTYSNGAAGLGATLTAIAPGTVTIDGIVPTVGDRVLVKNEATTANNGAYNVTVNTGGSAYILTRTTDYNQANEITVGDAFYVLTGTANANTTWVMTTTSAITVGTTGLVFAQAGSAGMTALTGDVTASGANSVAATLSTGVNVNVGTWNAANVTYNNKGLVTAVTSGIGANISTFTSGVVQVNAVTVIATMTGAGVSTFLRGDGNWLTPSGAGGSGITTLTGDVTASGSGSVVASLSSGVNVNVGTFISPNLTVNNKGLITAVASGTGGYTTVKSFGALGNGSTNDSTSITAAISGTPVGGTLFFPPGTYPISSSITVNKAIAVQLAVGTVIQLQSGANTSNVTLSAPQAQWLGGTIDGANTHQSTSGSGIVITANNCVVNGTEIRNTHSYGILVAGGCYNTIENCYVHNTVGIGIFVTISGSSGGNYNSVVNNIVSLAGSGTGDGGIKVHGDGLAVPVVLCQGNRIIGNHVENTAQIAIEIWGGSPYTVVEGNVTLYGQMGISADRSDFSTIVGNTVQAPTQYGIELANSHYATATGNTIDGQNLSLIGINADGGGSDHSIISSNTIKNVTTGGIQANGAYIAITANTVDSSASADGIRVLSNSSGNSGITVTNNTVNSCTKGIYVEPNNVTVTGNNLSNLTGNGVEFNGCNYCVCNNNQVSTTGVAIVFEESSFVTCVGNLFSAGSNGVQFVASAGPTRDYLTAWNNFGISAANDQTLTGTHYGTHVFTQHVSTNAFLQNNAGSWRFQTNGGTGFIVNDVTTCVNNVSVVGSASGNNVGVGVAGADLNTGLNISTKGSGAVQANAVNVLTSLVGDATTTAGPTATATLATVNTNVGTFTTPTAIAVNAKGLVTAVTSGIFESQLTWVFGGPTGNALGNGLYFITPGMPRNGTIDNAYAYTIGSNAFATVAVQLGTSGVGVTGLTALAATSASFGATAASGANVMQSGARQSVQLAITNASVIAGQTLLVGINFH